MGSRAQWRGRAPGGGLTTNGHEGTRMAEGRRLGEGWRVAEEVDRESNGAERRWVRGSGSWSQRQEVWRVASGFRGRKHRRFGRVQTDSDECKLDLAECKLTRFRANSCTAARKKCKLTVGWGAKTCKVTVSRRANSECKLANRRVRSLHLVQSGHSRRRFALRPKFARLGVPEAG